MYPAAERHRRILRILEKEVWASVGRLRSELEVNAMTLWRDLKHLQEQGLLKRIRGGAQAIEIDQELDFGSKLVSRREAKQRIACYAAREFVEGGDTIALEGGTTVAAMTAYLAGKQLKLVTNSLPVLHSARLLSPQISLYSCGGLLREESGTFVGREPLSFFARQSIGTFFMSATGIDEHARITDPNPQEIEVKRSMAASAKRIVLLLDSSKFGERSLQEVIALRKVHSIVCESQLNDHYTHLFTRNDVQIHITEDE